MTQTVQRFSKLCMQCWPGRKGKKVTQQEVIVDEFIAVYGVNLPDTIANLRNQLSSLQLDNVESVILVYCIDFRQYTDIVGCSNGVSRVEEYKEESGVNLYAAMTVDIPQFDARHYCM